MKASIMNLFGRFSLPRLLSRSSTLAGLYAKFPDFFKTYEYSFRPTFSHTNVQREMDMIFIAQTIGWLREEYGMHMLPGFIQNVRNGFDRYVLKTVASTFRVYEGIKFGERIKIRISVLRLDLKEERFTLLFSFCNQKTGKLMVRAAQEIFYVGTAKDPAIAVRNKTEFFRLISSLVIPEIGEEAFNLKDEMRAFAGLKNVEDRVYSFRWGLYATTEEGNTNHAAFVGYLEEALVSFLLWQKQTTIEDWEKVRIKIEQLKVCYLKDFHLQEDSQIKFFLDKISKTELDLTAIFLSLEGRGGALARIKLIRI